MSRAHVETATATATAMGMEAKEAVKSAESVVGGGSMVDAEGWNDGEKDIHW